MSESFANDERPEHEDPPNVDLVVGPGHEAHNRRFGRILAEYRQMAGLSRSEASTRLNVSAEYLRLIEFGRRTPAMGQMGAFLEVYAIEGELGRLQPGGDRPDLILLLPNADEPLTVDFASRIREGRRRGIAVSREVNEKMDAVRRADPDMPSERRAADLGYIVSLLTAADDRTLGRIYDLLEGGTTQSNSR